MKKLLITALALGLASGAARAGSITVTGYDLPDNPNAFGAGAIDGYSYYDGPILLHTSAGDIITYCTDLNHELHGQTYHYGLLTENGLGDPISQQTSHEIGLLAQEGFAALAAAGQLGLPAVQKSADLDLAAAVQLLIWSLEYPLDPVTNFADQNIADDFKNLNAFPAFAANAPYAEVLIPDGNWPSDLTLSQQMVVGLGSGAPEPSTWVTMLLGFAGVGYAAIRRRGKVRLEAALA